MNKKTIRRFVLFNIKNEKIEYKLVKNMDINERNVMRNYATKTNVRKLDSGKAVGEHRHGIHCKTKLCIKCNLYNNFTCK